MGKFAPGVLGIGHDSSALFVDVAWGKDEDVECGEDEESLRPMR